MTAPKPRTTIYSRDYEILLQMLREARHKAGVTQTDLAGRLRLTQSAVSKCERGELRLDVIQLRDWCRAIEVSFPALMMAFDQKASDRR